MSKAAAFDKQWKKKLGNQTVNPNAGWDAARNEVMLPEKPPGALSVSDYCKLYNCGRSRALTELKRMVAKRRARSIPGRGNGTHPTYYVLL